MTTGVVGDGIYVPYFAALAPAERELGPTAPAGEVVARRGFGGSPLNWARFVAFRVPSPVRGDFVEIPE
jgi:hypothetical protein